MSVQREFVLAHPEGITRTSTVHVKNRQQISEFVTLLLLSIFFLFLLTFIACSILDLLYMAYSGTPLNNHLDNMTTLEIRPLWFSP